MPCFAEAPARNDALASVLAYACQSAFTFTKLFAANFLLDCCLWSFGLLLPQQHSAAPINHCSPVRARSVPEALGFALLLPPGLRPTYRWPRRARTSASTKARELNPLAERTGARQEEQQRANLPCSIGEPPLPHLPPTSTSTPTPSHHHHPPSLRRRSLLSLLHRRDSGTTSLTFPCATVLGAL
jgi:hypothetical protein